MALRIWTKTAFWHVIINFEDVFFSEIAVLPPPLKFLSGISNSVLRQKDADSSTLQGRLLESLFQTSCAIETGADYVEVIQSNSCFLFSTRIDLSSTNEMPSNTVDSYSLPSSIWENFDVIREMYFPSNFIGTEHVTSNLELNNISKELIMNRKGFCLISSYIAYNVFFVHCLLIKTKYSCTDAPYCFIWHIRTF